MAFAPIRRFRAAIWRPIPKAARAVDDIAVDVGTAFVDGFTGAIKMFVTGAAHSWRFVREHAKKAIPSRSVRWTVLYVPGFTVGLLFALQTFGLIDVRDYVFEVGGRSVPVIVAIAIVYGLATGLAWNLDNKRRSDMQFALASPMPLDPEYPWASMFNNVAQRIGLFTILAGEMLSVLSLLIVVLAALLVFQ